MSELIVPTENSKCQNGEVISTLKIVDTPQLMYSNYNNNKDNEYLFFS